MERDAAAAAAALADIDAQQGAVRRRVDSETWPPPALGLLLGAFTTLLAWRNSVVFVVVVVIYFLSLVPLVGTPARFGVLPRDTRRTIAAALVAFVFVFATPQLAMAGPWWTALIAATGAVVFVPVFGRWRRQLHSQAMQGPAVLSPGPVMRCADAIALRPAFVPVAAVLMAGAVLAMGLGWTVAVFAYLPGQWLLLLRQFRMGAVPAAERTGRFWAVFLVAALILFGSPVRNLWHEFDGWLAAVHAVVVAATVALVGWWQQRRLSRLKGNAPRR